MTARPKKITDSPLRFFNYTLKVYSGTFAKHEHKNPEGIQERDWTVSVFKPSGADTWCARFVSRYVNIDVLDKESPSLALSAIISRLLWVSNIQHQVDEE